MNTIAKTCRPCCEGDCLELRRMSSKMAMLEDELYERNQALSQRTQRTAEDVRGIYEAKVVELEDKIRFLEGSYQQKLTDIRLESKAKIAVL